MNIMVKKFPNIFFPSLHIMAFLFVFKQGHIYVCKFLYIERYFNIIAELDSNYSFQHNDIYKNSSNVWNRYRIYLYDQNIELYKI